MGVLHEGLDEMCSRIDEMDSTLLSWYEEVKCGVFGFKRTSLESMVDYFTVKEGLIKSTCADWRANFHAPRGKKSQEYFVYFKIF